ncbi:MAG: tRNA (N6-isopentenyl adenosine(37)-C2)-methylthiotransferase MiaB, partial [Chloroflexota bacterium]
NKADSERLAGTLESLGMLPADTIETADAVIVNSCAVRQSAEDRVVGKLGFLKGLRRQNPNLIIALTGCMVPPSERELREKLPYIDLFLPPLKWDALLNLLAERGQVAGSGESLGCTPGPATGGNAEGWPTRYVPIIYGCDNFCTYCIVPFRRGREKSRPAGEVVADVERVAAQGAREVTLLGQNVDSYGHDLEGKPDLAHLLGLVNAVDGLSRIRFLTSHPKDMSDRLIEAMATLPKVCEHINLPVQAGDDRILGLMRRGYTVDAYRALIARIRAHVPGIALSTDLIVGFPGESREEFQRSYDLLRELRFGVVHVAMYSPRAGTAASKLHDDVPLEDKRERLRMVEELQESIAQEHNRALVGHDVEVLVERRSKGKWEGRIRGDTLVFFADDADWRGKLAVVRVERASAWSLQGDAPRNVMVANAPAAVL